jgi:hypothetical protein
MGIMMLRGISSTGHFGQTKQFGVNAFDTNCLMSADKVMANILLLAQNTDEELHDPAMIVHDGPAPPSFAFVAAGRGSNRGRGHNNRGGRGGCGLPNESNACGSLSHIMSSCTTSDDALMKWALAKRKVII